MRIAQKKHRTSGVSEDSNPPGAAAARPALADHCRALADAGYTVFGTTRSERSGKSLTNIGVTPVVCDYTKEMPKAQPREGDNQGRGFSCLHTDTRNDSNVVLSLPLP